MPSDFTLHHTDILFVWYVKYAYLVLDKLQRNLVQKSTDIYFLSYLVYVEIPAKLMVLCKS